MRVLPEAAEGLKDVVRDKLSWLDALLPGRRFIAGDRFTIADIVLFMALDFGATVGQPLDPALANVSACGTASPPARAPPPACIRWRTASACAASAPVRTRRFFLAGRAAAGVRVARATCMVRLLTRLERLARAARPLVLTPRQLFGLPPLGGYRVTRRRRLNLYLNRIEYLLGRTSLRSYPTRLVVEPASTCNLRCPYCLTGAGEVGRPRGIMTLELYHRLLDELGPWLFEIEAFHWASRCSIPTSTR